jgi:hypothetical protein
MRFFLFFTKILILGCVLISSAFSEVSNYSFRIKGMGGSVLDFTHDSYSDVFYNPAYVANIEGLHVYTNLSNLGSNVPASVLGNEISFLRNAIYPSNLVGFMGRWKFFSGGAFYVSEGYNLFSESTEEIEDSYQTEEEGTIHTFKYITKYHSNSEFNFSGRQIIGIGTINIFGFRLGLMGKLRNFKFSLINESSDISKDFKDGNLTFNRERNTTMSFETGSTFLGLTAGTVVGGEKTELSISAGIQPGGISLSSRFVNELIIKPYYQSWYYEYDQDPLVNFKIGDTQSQFNFSMLGSEIFGNARLMQKIGSATKTSIFGRLSTALFPIEIKDEYIDKYEANKPDGWYGSSIGEYGFYHFTKEVIKRNGKGSFRFLQIKTGIGFEHIFDNGALFVLGVKGTFLHSSGKIETDPRIRVYRLKYLENDLSLEDVGYIKTTDYNNSSTLKGNINLLYLEIPTALEFNIFSKWKFRIGSNQIIPLYGVGNYYFSSIDKPDVTKTEYTDGPSAGSTYVDTDPQEGISSSDLKFKVFSTNINITQYYTGLGYQVNENINVDIIHYTDLTQLNTWYLSFTVRF